MQFNRRSPTITKLTVIFFQIVTLLMQLTNYCLVSASTHRKRNKELMANYTMENFCTLRIHQTLIRYRRYFFMIFRTGNHSISFYYMIKYHRKHTFRFIVLKDKYKRYINSLIIIANPSWKEQKNDIQKGMLALQTKDQCYSVSSASKLLYNFW